MPSLKIRSDCVYIGIDPGQDGGLALLGGSKPRCGVGGRYLPPCRVELTSMPPTERDIWDWIFAKSDPPEGTIFAMIEKVHSMPKQGIASTFKFGVGYGGLRMALTAVRIPFEEVSPQAWQKALGIPRRKKTETNTTWKNRLKAKAQQLFPKTEVILKTADALLIAEYCRRKHTGIL